MFALPWSFFVVLLVFSLTSQFCVDILTYSVYMYTSTWLSEFKFRSLVFIQWSHVQIFGILEFFVSHDDDDDEHEEEDGH